MALSEVAARERAVDEQRDDAATTHVLVPALTWIWIAGLLIRLLLMPFTVHIDAYRIYSRAADAAYDGEWLSWGSQIVIQLLHDVWLLMIRPLLPDSAEIWSKTAGVIGVGAQPDEFARFLDYPYLARALFLMKLPYLAADFATGYVLTRFVQPLWRRRVLALWLLNPIVIFVSAVFGRHDSISIFLVVLSALLALRGRRYLGLALLGIGAAARFFPVFLAPFYAMAFRRSRRELTLLIGALVGFWMLIEGAMWLLTGTSPTLTLINRYPHIEYLVDLALPPGVGGTLFLFPTAFVGLLLWYAERRGNAASDYVPLAAIVLLVFFGLTHFHPQYTIWLVPFLALTCYANERLAAYHAVQIVLLILFTAQFGRSATWDLFLPVLGRDAARLPDPMSVVGALVPVDLYLGLVRSLFTTVSLWMAYRIGREHLFRRSRGTDVIDADGYV